MLVLAATSVGALGTLMAGWASANKYALLGGLRAAAQLVSYELPIVLAVASIALAGSSLSLATLTDRWSPWWMLWQLPGAVVFLVAAVAELQRPPFDMPVADAELVMGAWTEYTGLRFAFFLLAEYAGIVVMSLLFASLWLGGWHGPFEDTLGWLWTLLKGFLVAVARHLGARRVAPAARGPAAAAGLALARAARARPAAAHRRRGGARMVSGPARGKGVGLPGILKGLVTTARTATRPTHTAEYPDVAPDLPPRSRGVIALLEENCTSCMLCARECPDWCIYIDSHKETIPATTEGGRERQRNVLDRFAIDFSLCMYCGICIEVCPFDALHWSPQFEYAEVDILDLLHEKGRLSDWMATVPPPPALDEKSAEPAEIAAANKPARGTGLVGGAGAAGSGGPGARMPRTVRPRAAGAAAGVAAPPADRSHPPPSQPPPIRPLTEPPGAEPPVTDPPAGGDGS